RYGPNEDLDDHRHRCDSRTRAGDSARRAVCRGRQPPVHGSLHVAKLFGRTLGALGSRKGAEQRLQTGKPSHGPSRGGQRRGARASEDDIVQRRIGLPLGLLVDLMKDVHGKIHVSLPISGTLSAPNFSFSEAIWNTVRNTIVKLIAAPFKLIGKLFTGNENKI